MKYLFLQLMLFLKTYPHVWEGCFCVTLTTPACLGRGMWVEVGNLPHLFAQACHTEGDE